MGRVKTPYCIERISGWHSLDELSNILGTTALHWENLWLAFSGSNISKNAALHWENHIFSAFPAPQVAMTPAMVLELVTTDMETLFLRFYTISTQIWKHCFCAAAPHAVLCSGKAYFTLFVHIVVIYLLARMWSKNHETPGGGGSIFQKWSWRSSPWPQRLTTWQALFNSK